MRALYLLRHATPLGGAPGQADFERPLAPRGVEEAEAVGAFLSSFSELPLPGVVLCSPSRRTLDTLSALRPHLPATAEIAQPEALYCASARELLDAVGDVEDEQRGLLLIAHNPGIAALAGQLARSGAALERDRLARVYPAGALAIVAFPKEASWQRPRAGRLAAYRTPDELL